MARIRSIKPEFATDGKTRRLSDTAALFFILLWNHCDDAGYFSMDPLELSMKLARWRSQDVMRLLSVLHRSGMIALSQQHGLGMVVSWHHQRIDKPRPSKWKDLKIQWDDAPRLQERSKTVRCKDRIGEDRIGEDRISCTGAALTDAKFLESRPRSSRPEPITRATWEAYSEAYLQRYKTRPVRNASINGKLAQFVARVGHEEAPEVAAFYLTHNAAFYVGAMHQVGPMLKDAEKLRTEWFTNQQMNSATARSIESKSNIMDALGPMIAEAEERERAERERGRQ